MVSHTKDPLYTGFTPSVPLGDKNWFQTGGAAQWYSEPTTALQFQEVVSCARQRGLPFNVIGQGANILIADQGVPGLVIRPAMQTIDCLGQTPTGQILIRAGAGLTMDSLIEYCLAQHLLGLEEFSGIPGTVGGALFMNIHYFEFLVGAFVYEGTVLYAPSGTLMTVGKEWFSFAYNYSTLHDLSYYLVDAVFALTPGSALESAYARGRRQEIIRHRSRRYPAARTCGSFFRNFTPQELARGKQTTVPYIGYYLDLLGIKGRLSVGSAGVSHKHANMIVSSPAGTSADIITLARTMQQLVYDHCGLLPVPECRFFGFTDYPLLS